AEDGIRDRNVTGVQTCALPICQYYFTADMIAAIQKFKILETKLLPQNKRNAVECGVQIGVDSNECYAMLNKFIDNPSLLIGGINTANSIEDKGMMSYNKITSAFYGLIHYI